ncbi:MAG: hypothetical protein PHY94_05895 [Candidatus Omnitrophica bacterium]|nr:hypothetical protein [Candidatus Omnitrophota bacterium]
MEELKIPEKLKSQLLKFSEKLKEVYGDSLISVVLYGSAASAEFVEEHSNLNVLVVLKDTGLENLRKITASVNKFKMIHALFLSQEYIVSSVDIFPIEFLDMRENYVLLYGKDILKDINIDTKNLRFQCEQELKVKLLNLKQAYLKISDNKLALRNLLFRSFTSILHILRNVLRLKTGKAPYQKEEILKELSVIFQIKHDLWKRILAAKANQIKLSGKDLEEIFSDFVGDLEKIVTVVDKM